MDKLGRAQNNDEVWEALKTVKPEDYVKRKREQLVGGQILDLLKKSPEQERDYSLINYLASSIGYDDVGPIEQRPMPKEAFDQQLKLYRSKKGIDKYYGDREVPPYLRMQREREFMDYLDRGILYKGQPVTEEQRDQLQKIYLKDGFIPKEFDIEAKPLKPQKIQRPTQDIMNRSEKMAFTLIEKEWGKLAGSGTRKGAAWGFLSPNDYEQTFENLKTLPDEELDAIFINKKTGKFKVSEELYRAIKLGQKYGRAADYAEEPGMDANQYLTPHVQIDPNNPDGLIIE